MKFSCPQAVQKLFSMKLVNSTEGHKPLSEGRITIDQHQFCFEDNTVENDNGRQSVQPKVMLLFKLLFDERGNIVSRDRIEASLWPGHVVGLDSVNNTISRLRRLLNDNPKSPRYIETIPRKGYRLIKSDCPAESRDKDSHHKIINLLTLAKLTKVAIPVATSLIFLGVFVEFHYTLKVDDHAILHRDPEMQKLVLQQNMTMSELMTKYDVILETKQSNHKQAN